MVNAATELSSLIGEWSARERTTTIKQHRESRAQAHARSLDEEMVHAMTLMADVRGELAQLAEAGIDVSMYEAGIPSWWRAIAMPDSQWGASPNNDPAISPDALNLLRGLGTLIDAREQPPSVGRVNRDEVERLLNAVEELLSTTTMPEGVRAYVASLVAGVRDALAADDPHTVVDWVIRLLGTITFVAETPAQHEENPAWRAKFKDFGRKWSKELAVAGIVEVTKIAAFTAVGLGQIGS